MLRLSAKMLSKNIHSDGEEDLMTGPISSAAETPADTGRTAQFNHITSDSAQLQHTVQQFILLFTSKYVLSNPL